jgi:hypothetical protein
VGSKVKILAGLCLLVCLAATARGQDSPDYLDQVNAKKRLFPTVGAGLRAVRHGADGNFYILTAPGSSVAVFDPAGKLVRRIPAGDDGKATNPQTAPITFGEDMDVDAQGTVYVADRGANAIKVWDAHGNERVVKISAPLSVAALPEGEFAVATLHQPQLVIVYDKTGRDVREFGEPEPISERTELNRFLSIGILVSDGAGQLYYGFPYLPDALVRQYNRYGYAGQDFQYTGIDAWPAAQAMRKEINRQENREDAPVFKRILTAFGVDRASGDVWMALGDDLLHFDKEGNRRASYHTYTPEGARLEANTIIVETDRLIIGSDPLGIYEFARPDKKSAK